MYAVKRDDFSFDAELAGNRYNLRVLKKIHIQRKIIQPAFRWPDHAFPLITNVNYCHSTSYVNEAKYLTNTLTRPE